MNKLYERYIQVIMEEGVVELETFIESNLEFIKELPREEIEEFFDILLNNIYESIYTKAQELSLSEGEAEEIAIREHERLSSIKRALLDRLQSG